MIKQIIKYFDILEDRARARLSKSPVLYAFVGGIGIVLFWHSVTEIALSIPFMNEYNALPWFIVSLVMLLLSGIFVSYFVGDQLIISGIRGEKKIIDKTKEEIMGEEKELFIVLQKLEKIEKELKKLQATKTISSSTKVPTENQL